MAVAERAPASTKRGARPVDVGALVARMQQAAHDAIARELDSLAHDPDRIDGVTIEFTVGGFGDIHATHIYVSRRMKMGRPKE